MASPPNETFLDEEISAAQTIQTLMLDFGPSETVHEWCNLPECDEFVGSK